jgi:hypothetical protein
MRHFVFIGLMLAGMWTFTERVTAQVLKSKDEPKKGAKDAEKKPEWPKLVMGKDLEFWVKEMRESKDASTRDQAIRMLPQFGPDARKVAGPSLLYAMTKDRDINVKLTAISHVPVLGFDDANMTPGLNALVAMLDPSNLQPNHTKYEAVMALANCGPFARQRTPVVAALVKYACRDASSWQLRKAAAFALGRLGQPMPTPEKKDAPPPKEIEKDKSKIKGKPKPLPESPPEDAPDSASVKALLAMLDPVLEHSHLVRREAINSLMLLGPPHDEATWKELRAALKKPLWGMQDTDPNIALWSHVVFIQSEIKIIPPNDPNLKALGAHLSSKDVGLKVEALQAMGILGDTAKPYLQDVIAFATAIDPKLKIDEIKPDDLSIALAAIWVLSQMPSEKPTVIPVLDKLQSHGIESIKTAAKGSYQFLLRAKNDPGKKDLKKDAPARDTN